MANPARAKRIDLKNVTGRTFDYVIIGGMTLMNRLEIGYADVIKEEHLAA